MFRNRLRFARSLNEELLRVDKACSVDPHDHSCVSKARISLHPNRFISDKHDIALMPGNGRTCSKPTPLVLLITKICFGSELPRTRLTLH